MNLWHSMVPLATLMVAACGTVAVAQTVPPAPIYHTLYGVGDWREDVPERAAEYKNFRLIVLSNNTYSDDEKAAKIAAKYAAIRDALRTKRRDAYAAISEVRGVGNSATKGSSGGSAVESDAKCIGPSKEGMFTQAAWARGAYKSGDEEAGPNVIASGVGVNPAELVSANGASVCAIRLKQAGKGRKVAYSEATFKIRPEHINGIVDAELLATMYAITNTPI